MKWVSVTVSCLNEGFNVSILGLGFQKFSSSLPDSGKSWIEPNRFYTISKTKFELKSYLHGFKDF